VDVVITDLLTPVPSLWTVILAFAITAPVESTTSHVMPCEVCAEAQTLHASIAANSSKDSLNLR
jgi:hypothetical protein